MAAGLFTGGQGRGDEGGAPVQTIGQQERLGGQRGQQFQGQRPLGLTAPPDGRGQGMMQAQFEQHAGGELGKGGATAAAPGLARRGFDLGRVGQAELRASQRRQPRQKASG